MLTLYEIQDKCRKMVMYYDMLFSQYRGWYVKPYMYV